MKSAWLCLILLVAGALACSAYKSAGSFSTSNNAAVAPTPSPASDTTPNADQTCNLTLAQAPSIRGLSLNLTVDEMLSNFPGSKQDPEISSRLSRPPTQFGESSLLIKPAKYESKDKFTDINQIVVTFFDGRVSNVNIGYSGPEYQHVDDFVAKIVEGTNLPAIDQWQAYPGIDNLKILKCADFEIRVFAGGPGGNLNYVQLKDLEADKKLKDRKAKATAQATP